MSSNLKTNIAATLTGISLFFAQSALAEEILPSEYNPEDLERYVMRYQCVEYRGDGALRAVFNQREWFMPMHGNGQKSWLMTSGSGTVSLRKEHIDQFRRSYDAEPYFPEDVLAEQHLEFNIGQQAIEQGKPTCDERPLIS